MEQALAFAGQEHRLLIGGARTRSTGQERLEVINPSDESPLAVVPQASADDVERAVQAARASFEDGRWATASPERKTDVLLKLAALIEQNLEMLAALESLDNGKAISEARADVAASASVIRYYGGWPSKIFGETNPTESRFFAYTAREPVGVAGLIVPWNYPLLMAVWKLGPALATGNSVVLKPAEQTPLTALFLGELCQAAGVPEGVVNVVTGDGRVGRQVVVHPGVDKIAFTGSTEVGREIMAAAAGDLKRLHLELGGKNANIVFADADLDAATREAFTGAFENGGQACIAGSRLLVQRPVYRDVVERLADLAERTRVGPGIEEETEIGAIVSGEHLSRIRSYIEVGREEGADIVAGGKGIQRERGFYVRPTVFSSVTPRMRIAREEIFGPVVAVMPFDTPEEAVRIANDTPYGLAGAVWSRDVKRAFTVARSLRCGTVWINTYGKIRANVSFGGYKQSGFGRDLGKHSIDAYTEIKSVFVDLS